MNVRTLINYLFVGCSFVIFLSACDSKKEPTETNEKVKYEKLYEAPLEELSDTQYPDNPDISIRSDESGKYQHKSVVFESDPSDKELKTFNLIFTKGNEKSADIVIKNINLRPFIPYAPTWIKDDKYLTKVCLINQEWNRQQVKFRGDEFSVEGEGFEKENTVRVDIARNCLNSLLWEVFLYQDIDGKEVNFYHGWFTFPRPLYSQLFENKNNFAFDKYSQYLEFWKEIPSEKINFDSIRSIIDEKDIHFKSLHNELYPLIGERKKKNQNIVFPKEATKIRDFLTDSTKYATFSPPGFYNTADPRPTTLSLLYRLGNVRKSTVVSKSINQDTTMELRMTYYTEDGARGTDLVIGGINVDQLPILDKGDIHKGWQCSMGIANHTFYSTYDETINLFSEFNPYYGLIVDHKGKFLDSHAIGLDGPLMFREKGNANILHFYILSFERHSFVGHFTIDLDEK